MKTIKITALIIFVSMFASCSSYLGYVCSMTIETYLNKLIFRKEIAILELINESPENAREIIEQSEFFDEKYFPHKEMKGLQQWFVGNSPPKANWKIKYILKVSQPRLENLLDLNLLINMDDNINKDSLYEFHFITDWKPPGSVSVSFLNPVIIFGKNRINGKYVIIGIYFTVGY